MEDSWGPGAARLRKLCERHTYRRVAQAAAVLGSTEPRLVGLLADVSPRLAVVALAAMNLAGALRLGTAEPVPAPVIQLLFDESWLGPGQPTDLTRLRHRAARLLNDAGQPVEAIAALLVELPDLPEAWMPEILCQAASRARAERPAEAVRYLRRLAQLQPGRPEVALELAETLGRIDAPAAVAHLRAGLVHEAAGVDGRQPTVEMRDRIRAANLIGRLVLAGAPEPAAVVLLGGALVTMRQGLTTPRRLADRGLCADLEAVFGALLADRGATHLAARAALGHAPTGTGTDAWTYQLATHAMVDALAATNQPGAVEYARRVLAADPAGEPWPPLTAARVLLLADHPDTARPALDAILAGYQARHESWRECRVRAARALLRYDLGELAEAREDADSALRLATEQGWTGTQRPALIAAASLALVDADLGQAQRFLDVLAGQDVEDSIWEYPYLLRARANAAMLAGDQDGCLAALLHCGEWLAGAGVRNPLLAPWWVDAVIVAETLGQRHLARTLAEEFQERCRQWRTPRSEGLALLVGGVVAERAEQLDLLAAGAQVLRDAHTPAYHVAALLMLGRGYYQCGDPVSARRTLRDAMTLANRHGYTGTTTSARIMLTAAGGRTGGPNRYPRLTDGKRAVAELAAAGATNREIAEQLGIQVRTVEFHLTDIYRRYGLRRRADLASLFPPGITPGRTDPPLGPTGQRAGAQPC